MPIDAILIIVIGAAFGGLVNGLAGFGTGLFALNWSRLRRFLIPAVAGLPFGFAMLDGLNTGMLKLLVGSLLALFGGFFISRPRFARWQCDHKLADIAVGFIGGVLGHLPACLVPCQRYGAPFITGTKTNSAPYYNRLMCWFWASSCWYSVGAA